MDEWFTPGHESFRGWAGVTEEAYGNLVVWVIAGAFRDVGVDVRPADRVR